VDKSKQIISSKSLDILASVESQLDVVKNTQIDKDIADQTALFAKWQQEQKTDLDQQIHNFAVELKKESILDRLRRLEQQEEILTFFDFEQKIKDAYYNKGFPDENPADIPIEPEQTQFKVREERHFKPWPKYMNRPVVDKFTQTTQNYKLDSLRKIYFDNQKALTTPEMKMGVARGKQQT
jgi:hypothetical protein